jgi:GT2 family glycosyltransferase
MIAIVMAYYNRNVQLIKTLRSFTESVYKDISVYIVDDCSKKDIELPEFPFDITVLKLYDKTWNNSAPVFNVGFNRALKDGPDIIIIQNPECFHVGDVLSYASEITDEEYISFGCFKLNQGVKFSKDLIKENNFIVKYESNGEWKQKCAWGNHPTIDPVAFHYCSAITAKNLIKLNGFDERFSFGVSFEDDYLVRQVRNLGLKIEITETPFVVHQWHESEQTIDRVPELWDKNYAVLEKLIDLKQYKAEHLLTPDLCGI